MVLLIKLFRDAYDHLPVPFHLTGSDSCEIFFSKVGGMQGMERAYDFHELVGCANTVNKLAAMEYRKNGLQFDRAHNKQRNVWSEIHPLAPGELPADLSDYSELATDDEFVIALKEGFKAAQGMLNSLNMAPSTYARNKSWFQQPWLHECSDPKHWSYIAPEKPTPGEDGDAEVLRETMMESEHVDSESLEHQSNDGIVLEDSVFEDGLDPTVVAENECRDAISDMLDSVEDFPEDCQGTGPVVGNILPVVEYMGKTIFKSTLVSELNGNPFLSKDRLTRIKNSVYFNNAEDYLSAASSSSTCLIGLGSDCGVLFMQPSDLDVGSAVKAAQRRKKGSGVRLGTPCNVSGGADVGSWWLGRVQKIRRKVGTKWGLCRYPIDLLNRNSTGKKVSSGPTVELLLNWFKRAPGRNKFKYDATDTQWIDLDGVISTVALSFNNRTNIYSLEENDRTVLDEFVA